MTTPDQTRPLDLFKNVELIRVFNDLVELVSAPSFINEVAAAQAEIISHRVRISCSLKLTYGRVYSEH